MAIKFIDSSVKFPNNPDKGIRGLAESDRNVFPEVDFGGINTAVAVNVLGIIKEINTVIRVITQILTNILLCHFFNSFV
jgi:hypothetical protein